MARSAVTIGELCGAGMPLCELASHCVGFTLSLSGSSSETRSKQVRPVWGMGFSWSSCVAQETLLCICARAGLDERHVLAPGHPLPADPSLMFALATDDVMVFSDSGPGGTVAATVRPENQMKRAGVVKHPDKDVDDKLTGTCVGVQLVNGDWWWPRPVRL